MKIDENKRSAILDSLLKPEPAHAKDLHETNASVSKSRETIDKLELSTQKSAINRHQEKTPTLPALQKTPDKHDFIDKVELSTKKKPIVQIKQKEKNASTVISQDRINSLMEALRSQTYNAKLEFAAKGTLKSQLLDIVI